MTILICTHWRWRYPIRGRRRRVHQNICFSTTHRGLESSDRHGWMVWKAGKEQKMRGISQQTDWRIRSDSAPTKKSRKDRHVPPRGVQSCDNRMLRNHSSQKIVFPSYEQGSSRPSIALSHYRGIWLILFRNHAETKGQVRGHHRRQR